MEPEIIGYPVAVFYISALIGVALILYRPRWAFLFVLFCLAIRHYHMAVYTRTPFLKEYVNLNDLFLWIGVLAMLRSSLQGQKIWAPNILLAIIGINLVGDFQSLFQYGFNRDVLQSLWASWIFPILFLVSANMVKTTNDARLFYWVLFMGSLGAALEHLIFIQEQMIMTAAAAMNPSSLTGLRTIAFLASGGIFLLISAFYVEMRKVLQSNLLFVIWVVGLPFIAMSYLLSFTRTWWIGAFMTAVGLFFLLYGEQKRLLSRLTYAVALVAIIIVAFHLTNRFLLSAVDLTSAIDERADFVRYEDSFDEAYKTRETGMETELDLWLGSPIIWGVGGCYPPSILRASDEETGALGHVAFSTYLAHFGLIGLVTYGVLLPLLTIRMGRRYYVQHRRDFGGVLAITAMGLALFDVFTLFSSNQYLAPNGHVQALIYGALWGLSRSLTGNGANYSSELIISNQPSIHRLPGPGAK